MYRASKGPPFPACSITDLHLHTSDMPKILLENSQHATSSSQFLLNASHVPPCLLDLPTTLQGLLPPSVAGTDFHRW